MQFAERIHKPPTHNLLVSHACVNVKIHIVHPALGMINVNRLRSDVQIPQPNRRFLRVQMLLEITMQPPKPVQLKSVLFGNDAVALRHISVDDRDAVNLRLQNTHVFIVRSRMQSMHDVLRLVTA